MSRPLPTVQHYDQIIIGKGLAGTLLSFELISRGQKVLVIDANGEGSSTAVAGGMFNTMVFKRLVKAWMADELMPVAEKTYGKILPGSWNRTGLIRIFNTEQDNIDWLVKSQESDFEEFLLKMEDPLVEKSQLIRPFGYGFVPFAGRIDLQATLQVGRNFLLEHNALVEERVGHKEILFEPEKVVVAGNSAANIIYCEGHQAVKNPLFRSLPFKLAKGEVLTIKAPGLHLDKTINGGHFILPFGEELFKIGSTFEWKELNNAPTAKGKEWILERLRRVYSGPVEIVDHQAGIRPAVSDRRPIVGQHAELKRAYIFNGLGSRGGLVAPWLAKHFADHLLNGKPLNKEVDIKRFY